MLFLVGFGSVGVCGPLTTFSCKITFVSKIVTSMSKIASRNKAFF